MIKSLFSLILLIVLVNNSFAELERSKRAVDIASCLQQNWLACGISLGSAYFTLHRWNDVTTTQLLGHTCTGSIRGNFYRWKWVYRGKFVCPTLTTIEGNSENWSSKQGAVEHAVIDFMQKATASNVISQTQIKLLVNSDLKDTTTTKKPLFYFNNNNFINQNIA